jgi:asparagine synthase (glutamine-hydrolysing)
MRGGGSEADLRADATRMAATLRHRGPDDSGAWVDADVGIAFGFTRLAIIDVSPTGHQPMLSADGRFVIIFNGEIYNFRDLRGELAARGHKFRGSSDTEVILAGCSEWGIEATVPRLWGMFALAIWDRCERTLTLARDRIGKKPLYYTRLGDRFLFGSELKALRACPGFTPELDQDALALFMRFSYVPTPWSVYRGVRKLRPGCLAVVRGDGTFDEHPYWDALQVVRAGLEHRHHVGDEEAVEQLDALLRDAVARRMIADVPLGAFLSGGIDSSTVVALMQAQSTTPARTFSIGFHEDAYNEAESAKQVARHLGTDHTELYVTPAEARAVIPKLPGLYDEPFADSSQIPTFLVSELARQHVTVALSGDGGDELFGGYNRYLWARSIWQKLRYLRPVSGLVVGAIKAVPPPTWDAVYGRIQPLLPRKLRVRNAGDKAHKLADILRAGSADGLYLDLVSQWRGPEPLVLGSIEPPTVLSDPTIRLQVRDFNERMMYLDLVTYLPDDILVKVDRASMGVSLEARCPLLDHRVVEWAWRLPLALRSRGARSKWLLRKVLDRYVPAHLVERPKMGFGVPIDDWLRGPLREWAEALLDEQRLRREGLLEPAPIRAAWAAHLSGERNEQYRLWPVLMLQAWRERWVA